MSIGRGTRGIALGGFMAAGKTTIGRILAETLGLPFVDLDARIEQSAGRSVAAIFEAEGEVGFRARELGALDEQLRGEAAVLALGGGTLHVGDAPARIATAGWALVVLDVPWAVVRARLSADRGGRPLAGDMERLRALYDHRLPGYQQAGVVISAGDAPPDVVAARILETLLLETLLLETPLLETLS